MRIYGTSLEMTLYLLMIKIIIIILNGILAGSLLVELHSTLMGLS